MLCNTLLERQNIKKEPVGSNFKRSSAYFPVLESSDTAPASHLSFTALNFIFNAEVSPCHSTQDSVSITE